MYISLLNMKLFSAGKSLNVAEKLTSLHFNKRCVRRLIIYICVYIQGDKGLCAPDDYNTKNYK
jgi:hypothetical protein